ncbi:MAG: hypothetical protein R3F31_20750 [Verrucomicrobiales bacterium]
MFDYSRVTSVQIFGLLKDLSGNPLPYALVVVMLVASVLIYLTGKALFGRADFASSGRASTGRTSRNPPEWWAGAARRRSPGSSSSPSCRISGWC